MKKRTALLLLALAAIALPASDCDGNIGDVSTGPISFRVSAAMNFTPADGPSARPTTNFDGTLVAFESRALNLTRTEASFKEILLRDRTTLTTSSVSGLVFQPNKEGLADCEMPAMSSDGEWVVYVSKRDDPDDLDPPAAESFRAVFRFNRFSQSNGLIVPTLPVNSPATPIDGDCFQPTISANGQVIAFTSFASNIATTPAYTGNSEAQIFVVDLNAGVTRLLSHAPGAPGTPANQDCRDPVVSADGQWIVFASRATNLVAGVVSGRRHVYRASLDGSVVELVSRLDGLAGAEGDDHSGFPAINADGTLIAFVFQGGNIAAAPLAGDLGYPIVVRDYSVPAAPVNRVVAENCFLFGIFNPVLEGDRMVLTASGDAIAYTALRADQQDLEIRVASTNGGASVAASKGIVQQGATTLEEFWQPTISGDGRWAFWRSDYAQEVIGDSNALSDVFGYGPLR